MKKDKFLTITFLLIIFSLLSYLPIKFILTFAKTWLRINSFEAYECGSDTHAWNIVKIDGVYYHCDALWDENVDEWIYFNKSTGYIYNLPDRMHDLRRYPICDVSISVLEYCDCFGVQ